MDSRMTTGTLVVIEHIQIRTRQAILEPVPLPMAHHRYEIVPAPATRGCCIPAGKPVCPQDKLGADLAMW